MKLFIVLAVRQPEVTVETAQPWAGWLAQKAAVVLRLGKLDDSSAQELVTATAGHAAPAVTFTKVLSAIVECPAISPAPGFE